MPNHMESLCRQGPPAGHVHHRPAPRSGCRRRPRPPDPQPSRRADARRPRNRVRRHRHQPAIVWIALAILVGLFAIQRHGTDRVGRMFGPVMLLYFATIAAMGVRHIAGHPQVFRALSPLYIWGFFTAHPIYSFLSLGAVVYAFTGTEALYADMGHLGRKPITRAWLWIV